MTLRLFAAALALCAVPVLTRAADDDNPYKTAKKDDYATYKLSMKFGGFTANGTTTQTVTDKSDKEATIKVTGSIEVNGMKTDLPEQEQKVDLTKAFDPTKVGGGLPPGTDVKVEKGKEGKEKIKVNGKEYDSTWTTYTVKGKANGQEITANVKAWVSKDVPMGTVKLESTAEFMNMKMEMTMELVESGNKKK